MRRVMNKKLVDKIEIRNWKMLVVRPKMGIENDPKIQISMSNKMRASLEIAD